MPDRLDYPTRGRRRASGIIGDITVTYFNAQGEIIPWLWPAGNPLWQRAEWYGPDGALIREEERFPARLRAPGQPWMYFDPADEALSRE